MHSCECWLLLVMTLPVVNADEMNTQWDVSVPDSTLAAYVDDALAPLLNGKKDEKPAATTTDVKHLAPGEERTRRHTMPSIPSCAELFVTTTDVRNCSFFSTYE